jgi:hypothetical protein
MLYPEEFHFTEWLDLVVDFLLLSCDDAWLWCLKIPSSYLCMTCNMWLYPTYFYLNAYLASSSDAHFLCS